MKKGILYGLGIVFGVILFFVGVLGVDFYKDIWESLVYLFTHLEQLISVTLIVIGIIILVIASVKLGGWIEERKQKKLKQDR